MKSVFNTILLILIINVLGAGQGAITLLNYQSLDNNLDKLAEFPGGELALKEYFEDYFSDISEPTKAAINGPIEIQFMVNGSNGKIVFRTLYSKKSAAQPDDFTTAALFAVNDMPLWNPAVNGGYKVHSNHLITLGIFNPDEIVQKEETKVKISKKERPDIERPDPSTSAKIEIPNDPILIGMEIPKEEKEEPVDPDFIYRIVDKAPKYPGGKEALNEYIKTKIVNTIRINNPDLTGKIIAEFVINKSGNITDVLMVRSLCRPCGKLTKRQIESMPKWRPARNKGKKVNVKYSLLIQI